MRSTRRPGFALLDAIVGLFILASAGMAAVVMAASAARTVSAVQQSDAELRDADAFLHAVALWTRDDLDRRLGERVQGPWRLHIQRAAPELYVVALTDSLSARVLLRTALHRPEPATND